MRDECGGGQILENCGLGAFGLQLSQPWGGSLLHLALIFIGTAYLGGNSISFWKKSIFAAAMY